MSSGTAIIIRANTMPDITPVKLIIKPVIENTKYVIFA